MSHPPILSIHQLSIWLSQKRILNKVDLMLSKGQRIALLGHSGAGKSMIARAILGLLPPQAKVTGKVMINNINVTHAPALSRPTTSRLAMVMQDTQAALNPLVTIGYQLEEPLKHAGLDAKKACQASFDLLTKVGMSEPTQMTQQYAPELSGGQRQRICIAMALACKAPIIIADEPTSSLDVVTQSQILKLLHNVTSVPDGPGVLLITHDLHAAAHLCDQALVIEEGQIVENAPMQQILTNPQHAHTRTLISSARSCGIACEKLYA